MDVSASLAAAQSKYKSTAVNKDTPLTFDLAYLATFDTLPIDERVLAAEGKDKFILNLSRDNAQLLFNEIFSLPTEKIDDGIIAQLPKPVTPLPREKPLPKVKAETRWEKFAKDRGIQKRKRSRKIFDEQAEEYKPRYGYKRANDDQGDWLIEVPSSADPNEDQFEKRAQDKKERIQKNQKNQKKNLERAEKISRIGGSKILKEKKKGLDSSLRVTKVSTASLGKFDRQLKGEPKLKSLQKKNKFDPVTLDHQVEKTKALGVLGKLDREKAKKVGVLNTRKAVNQLQVENEKKNIERKAREPKKKLKGRK